MKISDLKINYKSLFSQFETKSTAVISLCGRYRYSLTRRWDSNKPTLLFIMLNPSTADAWENDPTIIRCITYANDWGYGELNVVNLFGWMDSNPEGLFVTDDPIGRDNVCHIIAAVRKADLIICAWGNYPIIKKLSTEKQLQAIRSFGKPVHCLELSIDGIPKHPLYLLKSLKPILYEI
ncbi:MAG TPA: DUF1643 domain-containing protein [Pedobacter sp.]|uniref:DUF1643 domain-containing protein n=1 Tax=Pedobacter sp. TaxID=1411316 RepID=UPI002BCD745F|nr:DUF1643 domain-containing protein [Pedobacter sp.]HMI03064.1 DUF1643 domain-containing protein [Pedobacter sp.]